MKVGEILKFSLTSLPTFFNPPRTGNPLCGQMFRLKFSEPGHDHKETTKMSSTKELGERGEDLAASYLEKIGFRILERNYRCRLGEIDLIAEKKKDGKILFVEVKTRRSVDSVSPRELISYQKQRHISRTAQHYISTKKYHDRSADFALLIVDWSKDQPVCELIEEAFELRWGY